MTEAASDKVQGPLFIVPPLRVKNDDAFDDGDTLITTNTSKIPKNGRVNGNEPPHYHFITKIQEKRPTKW